MGSGGLCGRGKRADGAGTRTGGPGAGGHWDRRERAPRSSCESLLRMTTPDPFEPTTRFSDRVQDYVRWRPGYPPAVLEALRSDLGLRPAHVVADIGSGTGLLSRLLVENGNVVYGVEPNRAMAAVAEADLGPSRRFHSVDGRAEATGLGAGSVDLVTAGQAFHWFKVPESRAEFLRILRPGGGVALVWNLPRVDSTPFLREYE